MVDKVRKVQKTGATVEQVTGQDMGQDMGMVVDPLGLKGCAEAADAAAMAEAQAALINAKPISIVPMAIEMRKTSGSTKVLKTRPKLVIVGYNVTARIGGQVNSMAHGGLLDNSQGRRSRSSSSERVRRRSDSTGRVADAATEDLVAQLRATSFDVIDPYGVSLDESNVVTVEAPIEGKDAIMAGPTTYGYH